SVKTHCLLVKRSSTLSQVLAGRGGEGCVLDITGVARGRRLEQQDLDFFVGHPPVLNPARYDQEFPFPQLHRAVTELDAEAPADHEKELVLHLVMMPDESPLALDQLHLLPVEFTDDLRAPVLAEPGKLFGKIDFFHRHLSFSAVLHVPNAWL